MKSICVFCGSNRGNHPAYTQMAKALGELMGRNQIRLVYGGGRVGLMGVIADAVMENGGEVLGVIPEFLMQKEVGHQGVSEMLVVDSMHERKMAMAEASDAFISMPGGIGTLEELFEVFTWAQLALHRKPIGLLNVEGYYDHLLKFLQHVVDEKFLHADSLNMLQVSPSPGELVSMLDQYSGGEGEDWLDRALL